MATLIFNLLSQDNPFDHSDRHLYKRDRGERQHDRANRQSVRETGQTLDQLEAEKESAEIAEREKAAAEQAELSKKMTDKVTERIDEVGELNVAQLTARIEAKRDTGNLSEEQLANLDTALKELSNIHSTKDAISAEAYREIVQEFTSSHLDLVLSTSELTLMRELISEKLELKDKHLAQIDRAHETRNLSELEKLALAFVSNDANGETPDINAERLKAGASYTVDFHNEDGSLNRYAHNNVNLGHILKGTGLRSVSVEKKNGLKVDAYLWPNGKTYVNAPWESTRGGYVAIVSGDKFTVNENSYATAPEADNGADELAERMQAEAREESESFRTSANSLETASLSEAESILEAGFSIDIPEDVALMRGADLEESLRSMDMGDQVIALCEQFAGLPGSIANSASGTSLFIDIMENGNRRKMTLKEITKAVFGVNDRQFMESYLETKKESINLHKIEAYLVESKTENPDMTSADFFVKTVTVMGDDLEARAVYYKYRNEIDGMFDAYTSGQTVDSLQRPSNVEAVYSTRKTHKKFLLGAHRLLEYVPHMKAPAHVESGANRNIEQSEDLSSVAEPALALIFDPNRESPETKPGLWNRLSRRTGSNANMGNMGTRVKYDEAHDYEKMFTSLYAYNHIREEVTSIENGVEVVDLNELARILEMYRSQGRILMNKKLQDERRETSQRVMYPNEPITVDSLSNMEAVSPKTIELIQHGMMVEQMKEVAQLNEAMIKTFPKDVGEMLKAIDGQYDFTPEEIQEIGNNIRSAQRTMLHATYTEVRHRTHDGYKPAGSIDGRPVNPKELNMGATQSFTVYQSPEGDTIGFSGGFNWNESIDTVDPSSYEQNLSFHLGSSFSKTIGAEERNHVTLSAGVAGPIPTEKTWGAGGSLSFRHDWGEYKTWSSGVSAGVGAPLQFGGDTSFVEALSLVHVGATLVDINQSNVVEKRVALNYAENKEYIDSQLDLLDGRFDEQVGTTDKLSPEQLAQVKGMVHEYYKQAIIHGEMSDMNTLQFDKIGLSVIDHPPYFLPHLGITIMGKMQMFYMKSSHMDIDEYASRALTQQAHDKGSDAIQVFEVSGDIVLTEEGERTFARPSNKAFDPYDDIDGANEYFMESQGLGVERVQNTNDFHLMPYQVDGLVEVYGDAGEGIDVKRSDNGEIHFSIPAGTNLAIHRVNHVMPLPDGGVQEITKIYITDNPNKSPEQVAQSSTHHVEAYMSQRAGGRNTEAVRTRHLLDDEVIGNNESEILEWDSAALEVAQGQIDTAFNAYEGSAGIGSARFNEIATAAAAANLKIDAKFKGNNEAYSKALLDAAKPLMAELGIEETNYAELTVLVQQILISDRSEAPVNKADFIRHIETWNKPSIATSLRKQGVAPDMIGPIAGKIASNYALSVLETEGLKLPETQVDVNAMVHTHIGGLPVGNVMEFMNGQQDSVALEGATALDHAQLMHEFKFTTEEARELVRAISDEMAPLNLENPKLLFQHPIALQLLEDGAVLLGPEYASAIANIANNNEQNASALIGIQAEAYGVFVAVMKGLTAQPGPGIKTYEYGGRTINIQVDMQMGFIYKCRNFTTTYKAKRLSVAGGEQINTTENLRSEAARTQYGGEVVGGVAFRDITHPKGAEKEPEGDQGTGERPELGSIRGEFEPGHNPNEDGPSGDDDGGMWDE